MEIRNPDKTHLPQVLGLLERCFPGRWDGEAVAARIFYDERYDPNHVWMAREGGQVLGFVHAVQAGSRGWIKLIAVDPGARRRGIARDLLSRAEFRLNGEGVAELRVESTPPLEFLPGPAPDSEGAAFFAANGYQAGESEEALYLPPLDRPAPADLAPGDRQAAMAWIRPLAPAHLAWIEEALACRPSQAVYRPGVGLCLARPGHSLGPLWHVEGAEAFRLKALAGDAWSLASAAQPAHPLGLRLWRVPGSGPLPGGRAQGERYIPFIKQLN